MRIFLTGGRGFIGARLRAEAIRQGHDVLLLEDPFRVSNPNWGAISSFQPEVCIHAAWFAKPGAYLEAPENEELLHDSLALFQRLAKEGVRRFVGLGTCLEYGPSDGLLEEDVSPISPVSLYARSKDALHQSFTDFAKRNDLEFCWARIFFPYGEGEDSRKLCTQVIQTLRAGGSFELKYPNSLRDYIHVDDVADALLFLARGTMSGTFNVGTGKGVSMQTLAETVANILGLPGSIRRPSTPDRDEYRSLLPSMRKLFSLNWRPLVPLQDGLMRLVKSLAP